jgi:hypothetical protein
MLPSGVERAHTPIKPAASLLAVASAAASSSSLAGSATKITSTSLA